MKFVLFIIFVSTTLCGEETIGKALAQRSLTEWAMAEMPELVDSKRNLELVYCEVSESFRRDDGASEKKSLNIQPGGKIYLDLSNGRFFFIRAIHFGRTMQIVRYYGSLKPDGKVSDFSNTLELHLVLSG